MKKLLWIFAALLFAYTGKLQAQIASFNFSKTSLPVNRWTNVYGDPSVTILTATAGGVTISSISTANWSANGASCAIDGLGATATDGFFPGAVLKNDWVQYNGPNYNLALYNSAVPQLRLSGLNKDSTYIIRMSGSSHWNSGSTQYTVSGTTVFGTQLLNCLDNSAQGVTFLHVQPDVNGIVNVYVNGNANDAAPLISGLQIYPGSSGVGAPAVTITTPVNGTKLGEGSDVVIKATAIEVGATISKVEFYADTVKIGEVDNAPYNFTWNNPDPGNYQITVKATDTAGTINTATTNIAIESLNYFWSTTGNIATGGDSIFVGTVDTNRLAFRTNNLERMSISKEGNVIIGVKDTSNHTTMCVYSNGGVLLPRLTSAQRNAIASTNLQNGLLLYNSDSSLFQYYNGSAWNSVCTNNGGSGRWLFNGTANTAYDSTDNIAIGTSQAPAGYKLAVKGSALFTRVQVVALGNWPDYVFKRGYRLRSLDELEIYIDKHKHLPEIVSAAKVGAEGVDLGANQAAMLKKVEELTLYLIDENKQLKLQNSQIAEQNKKIAEQDRQITEQNARFQEQQRQIDELKALLKKK